SWPLCPVPSHRAEGSRDDHCSAESLVEAMSAFSDTTGEDPVHNGVSVSHWPTVLFARRIELLWPEGTIIGWELRSVALDRRQKPPCHPAPRRSRSEQTQTERHERQANEPKRLYIHTCVRQLSRCGTDRDTGRCCDRGRGRRGSRGLGRRWTLAGRNQRRCG